LIPWRHDNFKKLSMKKLKIVFTLLALFVISVAFKSQDVALQQSMKDGKEVYAGLCIACHLSEGQGISSVFPPLAKSDYLMDDLDRSIKQLIEGSTGEIEVNGTKYNGAMPATGLDDKDIANVLNYVRNSWGNKGDLVKVDKVKKVRASLK
jgi:mono/diheme cytochrome c family protein